MLFISIETIAGLLINGNEQGKAQAKVLFNLLNSSPELTTVAAVSSPTDLTYQEKVKAHAAKGKAAKAPKKPKAAAKGKASQARNNHSAAKTEAYANGWTVPEVIIEWFGKKKSEKTIAQISEGTGLSNKEVGDTCWNLVKRGKMDSTTEGSYKIV